MTLTPFLYRVEIIVAKKRQAALIVRKAFFPNDLVTHHNFILFCLNYMYWDSSHEIDCIMALPLSPEESYRIRDAGICPGFCGFGTINTSGACSSPCCQGISASCSYISGYLLLFYFWGLQLRTHVSQSERILKAEWASSSEPLLI